MPGSPAFVPRRPTPTLFSEALTLLSHKRPAPAANLSCAVEEHLEMCSLFLSLSPPPRIHKQQQNAIQVTEGQFPVDTTPSQSPFLSLFLTKCFVLSTCKLFYGTEKETRALQSHNLSNSPTQDRIIPLSNDRQRFWHTAVEQHHGGSLSWVHAEVIKSSLCEYSTVWGFLGHLFTS